jgi:hypothetical protein
MPLRLPFEIWFLFMSVIIIIILYFWISESISNSKWWKRLSKKRKKGKKGKKGKVQGRKRSFWEFFFGFFWFWILLIFAISQFWGEDISNFVEEDIGLIIKTCSGERDRLYEENVNITRLSESLDCEVQTSNIEHYGKCKELRGKSLQLVQDWHELKCT